MVQVLLDLPEKPAPPDIADALALALCHLASAPLMRAAAAATRGASRAAPAAAPKPVPRLGQVGPEVDVSVTAGGRR
jgi:hypothetical protein